jgi:hypothetical protein
MFSVMETAHISLHQLTYWPANRDLGRSFFHAFFTMLALWPLTCFMSRVDLTVHPGPQRPLAFQGTAALLKNDGVDRCGGPCVKEASMALIT